MSFRSDKFSVARYGGDVLHVSPYNHRQPMCSSFNKFEVGIMITVGGANVTMLACDVNFLELIGAKVMGAKHQWTPCHQLVP